MDLSPGMVRRAQTDHGEFRSQVAALTALPFTAAAFDGVFMWYSTIHGSDDELAKMLAEAHHVLTPGGSLLVAFQTGDGVREVGQGIRARGHNVTMMRYHRSVTEMDRSLARAGFRLTASLDRAPVGSETDGQAVLIARRFDQDFHNLNY
ncbi:MAG TPA: class I SAM-dependent methyltransferase [Candidatus Nanopelagicales bacterium]|nr:class I SAM-dependent methyltransferase [Candidatus Nanopelagicales bacterium]